MSTPFSAEQVTAHVERLLERAKDRSKFDPSKLRGLLDADSDHVYSDEVEQPQQAPTPSSIACKKKRLPRRRQPQAEQSLLIGHDAPTGEDIACIHAVFSHVGLPRKRVQGDSFKRTSGDAWLIVQSGYADLGNGPVLQTIPYGPLPRLALVHMTSYAKLRRPPILSSSRV